MTREKAKEILSDLNLCHYTPSREAAEAIISALDPLEIISALTPPTREQMERVWPGCDFCKKELDDYPYIVAHGDYTESDTCYEPAYCPICSHPLTPEAWEELRKRWEAPWSTF